MNSNSQHQAPLRVLIIGSGFGGLGMAQVTRSIELFATRVMPFLAAEPVGSRHGL